MDTNIDPGDTVEITVAKDRRNEEVVVMQGEAEEGLSPDEARQMAAAFAAADDITSAAGSREVQHLVSTLKAYADDVEEMQHE